MGIFSILSVENRVLERWGGAVQLWAGKKLFPLINLKSRRKKFLTGRTPFLVKSDPRKCQF